MLGMKKLKVVEWDECAYQQDFISISAVPAVLVGASWFITKWSSASEHNVNFDAL